MDFLDHEKRTKNVENTGMYMRYIEFHIGGKFYSDKIEKMVGSRIHIQKGRGK